LLQSHPEISGTRQDEFLLTRVGVPVMLAEILRTQSGPIHYEELTRLYNERMEHSSHQTARHILYVLGEMKSIRRLGNGEYESK
jgi:Fe2+ or Zn2+ uptake regulation protein